MKIQDIVAERRAKLAEARDIYKSMTDDLPPDQARAKEREFNLAMADHDDLADQISEARQDLSARPVGPIVRGANVTAPGVDNGDDATNTAGLLQAGCAPRKAAGRRPSWIALKPALQAA